MTGCTIFDSNRGIGILSRDGGAMRRLLFSNLTFACHHAPPCHWGKADPLHISVRSRDPAITPGIVEQVQFSNVTGVAEGAIKPACGRTGLDTRCGHQPAADAADRGTGCSGTL
ncbi:Uncharacterised protein [Pantoea agglomerans]|uniref:Uncharacterized protein n=1 Tax=Enterobacter agglomerans TaxID=549 RepID=A0A379ALN9_ENTAG|nr:Uncharacterised protein [Pantoea agglomerans]